MKTDSSISLCHNIPFRETCSYRLQFLTGKNSLLHSFPFHHKTLLLREGEFTAYEPEQIANLEELLLP